MNRNQLIKYVLGFFGIFFLNAILLIAILNSTNVFYNLYSRKPTNLFEILLCLLTSGFPVAQLLYVVPLVMFLKFKEETHLRNGVVTGALITFLITSPCLLSVPYCIGI